MPYKPRPCPSCGATMRGDSARCRACYLKDPDEGPDQAPVSEFTRRRVLKRYLESEETVSEIAAVFGLTDNRVWRIVKGHANRMKKATPEMVAKAGRLYAGGASGAAVAAALGVGEARAFALVRQAGVPVRPAGWPERVHFGKRIA